MRLPRNVMTKNKINKLLATVLFTITFLTTLSISAFAANDHTLKIMYNVNYGSVHSDRIYINKTDQDGYVYHYRENSSLEKKYVQEIKDGRQDLLDADEIGLRRNGYEFKGWSVDSLNSKRIFNETTKYTSRQIDGNVRKNDVEIVLKAVWEPIIYSASFNDISVPYKNNDVSNLGTITAPQKEGYTFFGWKTLKAEGSWKKGAVYTPDDLVDQPDPFGNVSFIPYFLPNQIVFECNYDQSVKKQIIVRYSDKSVVFPSDIDTDLIKIGYTFAGWNTKKDGSGINVAAGKEYTENIIQKWFSDLGSQEFSTSKTLYAVWVPNELNYNVNVGGKTTKTSVFSVNSTGYLTMKDAQQKYTKTVTVDDSITLPDAKSLGIFKTGFQLTGWKFGNIDKIYSPGFSVKVLDLYKKIYRNDESVLKTDVTKEITVSAVWEPNLTSLNDSISVAIIGVKDDSEKKLETYTTETAEKTVRQQNDSTENKPVINKRNSLRYSYSDPNLKSLLISCYMLSTGKIFNLNQLTKEKIAEINTKDFKETIRSVLSKAYTTTFSKTDSGTDYIVSPFSYEAIIKGFGLDEDTDIDPYDLTKAVRKLIYDNDGLCLSVDRALDVEIPYGFSTVNGKSYNNKGIDVSVKTGTTLLYALRNGTVASCDENSLSIDYGDGFVVSYSGLSNVFPSEDAEVKFGEIIGEFQSSVHAEIRLNGTILPPDAGKLLSSLGFGPIFAFITKDYDGVVAEEYKISNNNIIWIKPDTEPSKKTGAKSSESRNTDIFTDDDYDYVSKGVVEIDGEKWYSTEVYDVIETDEEFVSPLPYSDAYLSSSYGERESIDDVTSTYHGGIDLCCESGTLGKRVVATASGVVIESGWSAYGNYVLIEHEDGIESLYGHLDSRVVEEGDVVRAGELIGYAGNTYGSGGYSTGAHLHFEIRVNGNKVNPYRYVDF